MPQWLLIRPFPQDNAQFRPINKLTLGICFYRSDLIAATHGLVPVAPFTVNILTAAAGCVWDTFAFTFS